MNSKKFFCFSLICFAIGICCMFAGFALGANVKDIYITKKGLQVEDGADSEQPVNKDSISTGKDTLDAFSSANIKVNEANFSIISSDHYGIEYSVPSASELEYEVKGDTLNIETKTYINENWKRNLFRATNFESFQTPNYIYVYVPGEIDGEKLTASMAGGTIKLDNAKFEKMRIENDFGNFEFGDIRFEELDADIRFGNIEGTSITGKEAKIKSGFGNSKIEKVEVTELSMDYSSGSVFISSIYGDEAELTCSFGEIKVDNVSLDKLYVDNSFGQVTLYNVDADRSDANVSFGEIDIKLNDINKYNMECNVDFGDVNISGQSKGGSYAVSENDRDKLIKAKCSFGEINID